MRLSTSGKRRPQALHRLGRFRFPVLDKPLALVENDEIPFRALNRQNVVRRTGGWPESDGHGRLVECLQCSIRRVIARGSIVCDQQFLDVPFC